jgi:YesN/AraC family two-component response regulator
MPGMNGIEMIGMIKEMLPEVKTVIMSGYAENGLVSRSMADPSITFINKPLLPVSLANTLRKVLDEKE